MRRVWIAVIALAVLLLGCEEATPIASVSPVARPAAASPGDPAALAAFYGQAAVGTATAEAVEAALVAGERAAELERARLQTERERIAVQEAEAQRRHEMEMALLTATAEAVSPTATAVAAEAAAQMTVVAADAQRQAAAAMATAEAIRRAEAHERAMSGVRLWRDRLLAGLGVAAALMTLWGMWRLVRAGEARLRVVHRDGSEGEPLIVGDGGVLLPQRSLGPVVRWDGPAVDPDRQERVSARAQLVEAMRGGGRASSARLSAVARQMTPPSAETRGLRGVVIVQRLDQAVARGVLPPPLARSIEATWQEVIDGEEAG